MFGWYYGTKCGKKISLTSLHHQQQPELCFHVVYTKFLPYDPNVKAEMFSECFFLSSVVQF